MKYIQGELRNAFRMTCLDDQIDENDMVRVIDAIVDSLNPTRLGYKEKLTKSNAG